MILKRVALTKYGTFGVLLYGGTPFAVALEREWKDNQPNISCIPAGVYTCKRITSPTFGNTFEVMNVPRRSHILFHKGNLQEDSQGCILVGEQYGNLWGNPGVLASRTGFLGFLRLFADVDFFQLTILNC